MGIKQPYLVMVRKTCLTLDWLSDITNPQRLKWMRPNI